MLQRWKEWKTEARKGIAFSGGSGNVGARVPRVMIGIEVTYDVIGEDIGEVSQVIGEDIGGLSAVSRLQDEQGSM